ncbi:MAG: hypothetical protein ACLP9L_21145 [Thermoguttaceae bacterium]
MTGIIGYALSSQGLRHEDRVAKRTTLIEKLEETHQVTRSLVRSFGAIFAQNMMAVAAPNDPEFVKQLRDSYQPENDATIDHLTMLVDFYFPELRAQLQFVSQAQQEYGEVMAEIIRCFPTTDSASRRALMDRLQAAHAETQNAFRSLQNGLSAIAGKVLGYRNSS